MSGPPPGEHRRVGRLIWFVTFYAVSLVVFTGLVYLIRMITKGG